LIYGIPGQTIESWINTLEQAVAFAPEHLSCYQLTLETTTPLGKRHRAGKFSIPGEELQYEFFMKTSQFLEEAGYIHYEVSNFKRGTELASRHNQKYWDHSPYSAWALRLIPSRTIVDGGTIAPLSSISLQSTQGSSR